MTTVHPNVAQPLRVYLTKYYIDTRTQSVERRKLHATNRNEIAEKANKGKRRNYGPGHDHDHSGLFMRVASVSPSLGERELHRPPPPSPRLAEFRADHQRRHTCTLPRHSS